jgi:hypothetical protein
MGRPIPSFRIASVMEEQNWKSFRHIRPQKGRKGNRDLKRKRNNKSREW